MPVISLIVAMDRNGLIGRKNGLPWHLPADLKHFKATTLGKPIIMGRKTYESIGRPLPGRHNIVVSRNPRFDAPGCTVVHSAADALAEAGHVEEVMIIGGAQLYIELLPHVQRIYLTRVQGKFEGDAWFPELNAEDWREISHVDCAADEKNAYPYSFLVLERKALT